MVDDGTEKLAGEREAAELRAFGRRRGRKASDRQRALMETLLPQLAVDPQRVA